MGAIVFWCVLAALAVAMSVTSVVSRRRRAERIEALLGTPGAAERVADAELDTIRRVGGLSSDL